VPRPSLASAAIWAFYGYLGSLIAYAAVRSENLGSLVSYIVIAFIAAAPPAISTALAVRNDSSPFEKLLWSAILVLIITSTWWILYDQYKAPDAFDGVTTLFLTGLQLICVAVVYVGVRVAKRIGS
jgi:hypothetical protein